MAMGYGLCASFWVRGEMTKKNKVGPKNGFPTTPLGFRGGWEPSAVHRRHSSCCRHRSHRRRCAVAAAPLPCCHRRRVSCCRHPRSIRDPDTTLLPSRCAPPSPPCCRRRCTVALPPPPPPPRCCHSAAAVALCAAITFRTAAAAAAPLPSCRQRRAGALPPPPQHPRCCNRAAAVALPRNEKVQNLGRGPACHALESGVEN
jgi:hypothetical protein